MHLRPLFCSDGNHPISREALCHQATYAVPIAHESTQTKARFAFDAIVAIRATKDIFVMTASEAISSFPKPKTKGKARWFRVLKAATILTCAILLIAQSVSFILKDYSPGESGRALLQAQVNAAEIPGSVCAMQMSSLNT